MTSFDRVLRALRHKEPDRVPFDLGATGVTGINIIALKHLHTLLGLPNSEISICSQVSQTGNIEEKLADQLNIDIRMISPNPAEKPGLTKPISEENNDYKLVDELGIEWRMPKNTGHYFDLYASPLQYCEKVEDVDAYPWPIYNGPERYQGMQDTIQDVVERQQRAFVVDRSFSGMWETALWMRGYEEYYCDMLMNKPVAHRIMEQLLERKMQYWEHVLEAVGNRPMILSMADDLGQQNGLLISLELYKEMVWNYHKRLIDFVRSKAQGEVFVFFHNDGACAPTIPLLIDAGVDILNPVQVNCKGMDTKWLKREYGSDVTFWGALCDSQSVLPYGTPSEVREETKRRINDMMSGGGFIAAPIHNIQSDVPAKNIIAMWETLMKFGKY